MAAAQSPKSEFSDALAQLTSTGLWALGAKTAFRMGGLVSPNAINAFRSCIAVLYEGSQRGALGPFKRVNAIDPYYGLVLELATAADFSPQLAAVEEVIE